MHRIPRTGSAHATVEATPEQVWAVLADVTRVGEWSHECGRATWRGADRRAAVGVRFRGHNAIGRLRWSRLCEFVRVEPPRSLTWRLVGVSSLWDCSEWSFELVPEATGRTRIEQRYRMVRALLPVELFYAQFIPPHRDRTAALTADLRRLGTVAAAAPRSADDHSASQALP